MFFLPNATFPPPAAKHPHFCFQPFPEEEEEEEEEEERREI